MTNKEYAIKLIIKELNHNNRYLHTTLSVYRNGCQDKDKKGLNWCKSFKKGTCSIQSNCYECFNEWLNEEYCVPMPILENGMFVGVQVPTYGSQTGVIVGDNIVYQTGTFDSIDKVKNKIIKVYDAKCFAACLESNVVWRNNND